MVDPRHQHPRQIIEYVMSVCPNGLQADAHLILDLYSLPLPTEAPIRFRMLPEYLIENISDYLEFVIKYAKYVVSIEYQADLTLFCYRNAHPKTLERNDKDTIVTFMLTFLSPGYVNNPFLKAKFMSVSIYSVLRSGAGAEFPLLLSRCLLSEFIQWPTSVKAAFTRV